MKLAVARKGEAEKTAISAGLAVLFTRQGESTQKKDRGDFYTESKSNKS